MRLPSLVSSLAALSARSPGDNGPSEGWIPPAGAVASVPEGSLSFVLGHSQIVSARMDPIVQPGEIAGHVHNVFGASNFRSVLNSPEDQMKAACTTAPTTVDMSNYWSPTLYFMHANNTYEPIPSGARTYYFGTKEKDYITPFPRGMRIVSGTAMSRDLTDIRTNFFDSDCKLHGQGVDGGIRTGKFLPNGTNAPGGCDMVRNMIFFPSCGWANQSLDSDDHFSHLTWPVSAGGGHGWKQATSLTCPPTHPIKYPTLMMETIHFLPQRLKDLWRKGEENVMLSNGDTVGHSYHADFVSGWDEDVLKGAIACAVGDELGSCASLAPTLHKPGSCLHEGLQPAENVGYFEPLTELPGANRRWGPEMGVKKPDSPSTPTPGWTRPNVVWSHRGRGENLLIPAPVPPQQSDMTKAALMPYIGGLAGHESFIRGCQEDGGEEWDKIKDRDAIKCGTNQDFVDNKDMGSARNKVDDHSNAWESKQPARIVGQDRWRILNFFPWDDCWTIDIEWDKTGCHATTQQVIGNGTGPVPEQPSSASSAVPAAPSAAESSAISGSPTREAENNQVVPTGGVSLNSTDSGLGAASSGAAGVVTAAVPSGTAGGSAYTGSVSGAPAPSGSSGASGNAPGAASASGYAPGSGSASGYAPGSASASGYAPGSPDASGSGTASAAVPGASGASGIASGAYSPASASASASSKPPKVCRRGRKRRASRAHL